jgi:hypothetical protein
MEALIINERNNPINNPFKIPPSQLDNNFENVISAHTWAYEHYEGWINSLQNMEYRAIYSYCLNDYKRINPLLRELSSEPSPENSDSDMEIINNISTALKRAKTPEDIVVYRGLKKDNFEFLETKAPDELVGKVFTEKAFMSTSLCKKVANKFANNGILLKIHVPKNSNGAYVATISEKLEAEILFDKNQKLQVQNVKQGSNFLFIECKLLPSVIPEATTEQNIQ